MPAVTITCDRNANLKILRKLETAGLIDIHAVAIEGIEDSKKIGSKEPPVAVWDSPFTKWDDAVWAPLDSPYIEIEKIIGRHNHGDVLHLERHIISKRDVFVTDDNDFLQHRELLQKRLGVRIMTVDELRAHLKPEE